MNECLYDLFFPPGVVLIPYSESFSEVLQISLSTDDAINLKLRSMTYIHTYIHNIIQVQINLRNASDKLAYIYCLNNIIRPIHTLITQFPTP